MSRFLKYLMLFTRVSIFIQQLVVVADAIDDMNHEARADGIVTPEEEVLLAGESAKLLAPMIAEARLLRAELKP